jgi:hypothetical protein
MWKVLNTVAQSFVLNLLLLICVALVLNREGQRVPGGNEKTYLLYIYKAWHPDFLAGDWTFQEPTAGHPVFNYLAGWPTLHMSLETVGWIGRFFCWTLTFIALLRIGSFFRIPRWVVTSMILIWMFQRQAFIASEWIIGTFEAKSVAYVCLLFAIDFALRKQLILPAILTGLAFTFHTEIGLWGGAAIGLAFATMNPWKKTVVFAAIAAVFAVPGIVTALPLMLAQRSLSAADAQYMVTVELPFHLNPDIYGKGKIVLLLLMLLFNFLHARANPKDDALRFLVRFQIFTAIFLIMAIGLGKLHLYSLMISFPSRVFAVLILLFFLWHVSAAYVHRREMETSPVLVVLGVFIVLCIPSPMMKLQSLAADQLPKWRPQQDDFADAARWVRDHTSVNTVVIAPPWRADGFYLTHRSLIAAWHTPRFDATGQWRQRIESLVGDLSQMEVEDNLEGLLDQRARDFYAHLSEADLAKIAHTDYPGHDAVVISTANYNLPLLKQCGTYAVYRLKPE